MKISTAHQRFAERLRNSRVLDYPEEFLGPNWKDVLNFWLYLDTLNEEQWNSINSSLSSYEHRLALNAAWNAARAAVGYAACYAADYAAWSVAALFSARYATDELIGSHILQEKGKSLVFFPMFLNV